MLKTQMQKKKMTLKRLQHCHGSGTNSSRFPRKDEARVKKKLNLKNKLNEKIGGKNWKRKH